MFHTGPISFNQPSCRHAQGCQTPKAGVAAEQTQTKSVSVSSSTVTLNGYSSTTYSMRSSGVESYQAVEAAEPVSAPQNEAPSSANPYAQAILSSIELQIQRDIEDGATPEELQSRLEAGLSGFMEGYSSAMSELEERGMLTDEVRTAVEATFDQVRQGIAGLAEELGLENPVKAETGGATVQAGLSPVTTEAPASPLQVQTKVITSEQRFSRVMRDMEIIKSLKAPELQTYDHLKRPRANEVSDNLSYTVAESRDFQFKLKTQDGDVITVRIANAQAGTTRVQMPSAGSAADVDTAGAQGSIYKLDIDGHLDEDELVAVDDLLAQVGDISEMFYSGEMNEAVTMLEGINFDTEELSGFRLRLEMTSTEQITQSSAQPTKGFGIPPGFEGFFDNSATQGFFDKVDIASHMAEQIGLSNDFVPEMLGWMNANSQHHHGFKPQARYMEPMAKLAMFH